MVGRLAVGALISSLLLSCGPLSAPDPFSSAGASSVVSPVAVDPDEVVQFEPVGRDEGYLIAAPIGSRPERLPDGTAYVFNEAHFHGGSLVVSVRLRPTAESDAATVLSSFEPHGSTGPVEVFALDEPGLIDAARAFRVARTPACDDRWVVEGVALRDGQAYLIRVEPDAPSRCDARQLPDTQPILETFAILED